jgi:hypothetical protein
MQWLTLTWLLTIGYSPIQLSNWNVNSTTSAEISGVQSSYFTTDIGLSAEAWNHVRLSTDIETYEITDLSYTSFFPFRANYTISLALYAKGIELGIRHECDHPIVSTLSVVPEGILMDETTVYIKLSGKASF